MPKMCNKEIVLQLRNAEPPASNGRKFCPRSSASGNCLRLKLFVILGRFTICSRNLHLLRNKYQPFPSTYGLSLFCLMCCLGWGLQLINTVDYIKQFCWIFSIYLKEIWLDKRFFKRVFIFHMNYSHTHTLTWNFAAHF